jgi:His-Xaa-Ser system protein HxsD
MSRESAVQFDSTDANVVLFFDESIYPRDVVFGAAYVLMDRCFVHIDRDQDKLLVRLRPKPGISLEASSLAGDFENEAIAQLWRREILKDNGRLLEDMTTRVLSGAAGAPSLDDLLDTDLSSLGEAFDDPLGIAVSWEEKYGKQQSSETKPSDNDSDSEGKPEK